jgi:hypothetical protein
MSDKCQFCGASVRRDAIPVGPQYIGVLLPSRWLCGTQEHATGGYLRSVKCCESELASLRAENLRMREALESIITHQEIVAGPESSLLSSTARIARSALSLATGSEVI